MRRIYLDHNATTPLDPRVSEAMQPYMSGLCGNPSSAHWYGQEACRAVDRARRQVAQLIGADPGEVVFCSGGTEADSLALVGSVAAWRAAREGTPRVVTSVIEHPAVLETCEQLRREGAKITRVGVDGAGRIDLRGLEAALAEPTALVSLMLANNDVGTIEPLSRVAALTRPRGISLHSDAVQAPGKLPIDVDALGVDLLSLSAHKLGGPKGVGALYVRRGTSLRAQLLGGEQELRRRAGTENVPGIVGFGVAAELAAAELDARRAQTSRLRDRLEAAIAASIADVRFNGHRTERLCNTASATFDGVDGGSLQINLDLAGIAVSVGSACASGKVDPSHVLLAMGHTEQQARSTLRFSLGPQNSEDEIDATVAALVEAVGRLRGLALPADESRRLGRGGA